MKLLFFDLETTGIKYWRNGVHQISGEIVIDGVTKESFNFNVCPHPQCEIEEIGCFALVLEKIPAELAARVASELTIPVIGIGAGGGVDGQVLVMHDMLGINQGFLPVLTSLR